MEAMEEENMRSLTGFQGGLRVGPAAAILAAGLLLAGCKEDCSQAARMGDFEFSQGNYANAVRQYETALRADAKCGVVGEKLAEAKRKASAEK
jgi:lipopolysaccharide biosynthesis regulator YciM